jgi:NAD(P)-dependent dehydrogenase (short-subunit alcohol dehydrogenase family)
MIILVTGGASGLGESITRRLAAGPDDVVYFTYYRAEQKAKQIEADFTNAFGLKCNFKDENDVARLKGAIGEFKPDVLINNAYFGSFMKAHFHKIPADDFLLEFKENVIPTLSITQAAIDCFRKKKRGKIITILTSALVNIPPAGAGTYVANKAYLGKMTKVWAAENSKHNITSNTVSPSFMLSAFTKDIDERIVDQVRESNPLKRLLTTQEVAETVAFLTNAPDHINGIDMLINAGSAIR